MEKFNINDAVLWNSTRTMVLATKLIPRVRYGESPLSVRPGFDYVVRDSDGAEIHVKEVDLKNAPEHLQIFPGFNFQFGI